MLSGDFFSDGGRFQGIWGIINHVDNQDISRNGGSRERQGGNGVVQGWKG
jgi:hypothetical protein